MKTKGTDKRVRGLFPFEVGCKVDNLTPEKKLIVVNTQELSRKRIGFIRLQPKLRLKDCDLHIGYWNIRTLLQLGKMNKVADEIAKYGLWIFQNQTQPRARNVNKR